MERGGKILLYAKRISVENKGGGDTMPRGKKTQGKMNNAQGKKRQEETAPGYGNKKLEGPDRPST
jgi:hypothetical protein